MHKIKTRYYLIAAFILTISALGIFAFGDTKPTIPNTKWSDDGNYDISWYKPSSGDFTVSEQRSYDITSADQLAGLAYLCNEKGVRFYSYVGSNGNPQNGTIVINIKNDIDLSAHEWVPIGRSGQAAIDGISVDRFFNGTFNGHGKKISGVMIEEDDSRVGFFGQSGGSDALITNVVLDKAYVHSIYTGTDTPYTGGLVAYAGMSTYGGGSGTVIDNCIVSGYIGGPNAGGIVGANNSGSIKHCVNMAKVVGSNIAGGIIATVSHNAAIAHCVNMGEIGKSVTSGATIYAGGIVGDFATDYGGSSSALTCCANVGKSDGGALIGHLSNVNRLDSDSKNYWLAGSAEAPVQENSTSSGITELGMISCDSEEEMPAVAVLLDEVPYTFYTIPKASSTYFDPCYLGGIFTIKPTIYPRGSKYAATASISCDNKEVFPATVISADGVSSAQIYVVNKDGSRYYAVVNIRSGVAGNPVGDLRGWGDIDGPAILVWTTPIIEQSITLDPMTLSLDMAGISSDMLEATLSPDTSTSKDITWSVSGDTKAVELTGSGNIRKVIAKGGGTAEITAKSAHGLTATCTVTVKGIPVTGVTLSPASLALKVGQSGSITAAVSPDTADQTVTWSSDKPTVATVTDGTVTAVSAGTAVIMATSKADPEKSAPCTVTVTQQESSGVTLSIASLALKTGQSGSITAAVLPAGVDQTVTWSSNNSAVATVTDGTVTAVSAGTAVITATSKANSGKSASCTVTVTEQTEPTPQKPSIDSTIIIPVSIDTSKTAVEYTDTGKAAAALSSDITSADLEVSSDAVYMTAEKTTAIITKSLSDDETLEKIERLPIFEISTDKEVAACTWKVKGAALLADTIEAVDVRKIISSTQTLKFTYTADPAQYGDGKFTVLTAAGKPASGDIDTAADYQLLLFIRDGGSYDLNNAAGVVSDPAVIVKTSASTPSPDTSSGSSGGCSAGVGIFALLVLVPMVLRRKK